jgi:SEC-C motif-containing protein
MKMICPCGSKLDYDKCCESIILKKIKANSPEQLMRSRYSAYALQHSTYIFDTYAKASKINQSLYDIDIWAKETKWLNLTIIASSEFRNVSKPTVEFEAIYKNGGVLYKMKESSTFTKEDDFWRYVEGSDLSFTKLKIPKRNDECICLSGKKYKKCCDKY